MPSTYLNWDQSLKSAVVCNSNALQNLARPKVIVNDWLTVTNWVPRVNDAHGQSQLPKDSNSDGLRTDYCRLSVGLVRKLPEQRRFRHKTGCLNRGMEATAFASMGVAGVIVVALCLFLKKH